MTTETPCPNCERFRQLLDMPEEIRAAYVHGLLSAEMKHWAVRALSLSLRETLGEAPNFVTMDVATDDTALTVTVQRKHGLSPVEAIGMYRMTLARLAESCKQVLSLWDDPCPYDAATTRAAARQALAEAASLLEHHARAEEPR